MKKMIRIGCICLGLLGLGACNQNQNFQTEKLIDAYQTPELPQTSTYKEAIDDQIKVQLAINRRKQQTQIRKGDYMMSKNNPKEALTFYLPLLAKLPDDIVLYKKIANAYFELKDWKNAYAYFVRVPLTELSSDEEHNMIMSLFSLQNAYDRKWELAKFSFSIEQRQYYTMIDSCYQGIAHCMDLLWNYDGSSPRLLDLQKIVKESYKVSPEESYRDLLVAKKLYEQNMYRLVGMMTAEILATHPQYFEAIKMRAFALYELGKYQESEKLLLEYLNKNPKDLEVIIRLGEVYTFLGDYVTANLYLNNAILAGYSPKTLLERRLAYNYEKLWDFEWMQKVLAYLLQESDVAEDDFGVAISFAIQNNDYNRAYSWGYMGFSKFPNSKIIAPLYLQSLRLVGKLSEAFAFYNQLSDENKKLPVVELEKAILLFSVKNDDEASKIFQKLIAYDESADFAIEAKHYLDRINERKKQELSQSGSITPPTSTQTSTQKSSNFWDF